MRTFTSSSSSKRLVRSALSLLLVVLSLISATTSAFAAESESTSAAANLIPVSVNSAIPPLYNHSLGSFSFTRHNVGAWHTAGCGRMRFRIQHKEIDNEGMYVFSVSCQEYGGKIMTSAWMYGDGSTTSDGYHELVTDYFPVVLGCDYRLIYHVNDQVDANLDRRLNIRVFVDALPYTPGSAA